MFLESAPKTTKFHSVSNPPKQNQYLIMYLLTAIGLTPGDSSTVHIYTQTICRTTQLTTGQHN